YPMKFRADTSKSSQTRTAMLTFKTVNDTLATLQVTQRPLGISVLEDLTAFRNDVNAMRDLRPWMDSDSTVHLLADIDMSPISNWVPIGLHTNALPYSSSNSSFAGVFDGNGHKISYLNIKQTALRSIGLFGYVREAVIRNLILDHTCAVTIEPGSYQSLASGGICGTLLGGLIENCHFMGTVKITGSSTFAFTGGIAGVVNTDISSNPGHIVNSYNSGNIGGLKRTGGIVGMLTGSFITGCENRPGAVVKGTESVGGVCGFSETRGIISNSLNYGRVEGSLEMTGGICGDQYSNSSINDCVNKGTAVVKGTSRLGGICGYSRVTSNIKNCRNEGNITAVSDMGGICGTQYNKCLIRDCTNTGSIVANGTDEIKNIWIGGIVGGSISSDVLNSENQGTVAGAAATGGIAGYFVATDSGYYTINACTNTTQVEGIRYVGGVAGVVQGTGLSVYSSSNSGAVTATSGAGGIVGNLTDNASIDRCDNTQTAVIYASVGAAGGIAGMVNAPGSYVSNSENNAPVSSGKWAGGIVAYSRGKVSKCVNTGDVTTPLTNDPVQNPDGTAIDNITVSGGIVGIASFFVENCENTGAVSGYSAGGVVSRFTASSTYKIKNCKNSGPVTGSKSAGGIAASNTNGGSLELDENTGSVTGSYNVGGVVAENIRGSLTECHNSGKVSGTETEMNDDFFAIAGICAINDGGNLTGCINSGAVTRISQSGEYKFVGGVLGTSRQYTSYSGGVLKDCSNSGTVSGYHNPKETCFTGGFCGFYYSGSVPPVNCTNTGTVNGLPAGDDNLYGGF
ncbi:MAG: GLUG motif-containing protein, partial [Bacteroidales bacterium]